MSGSHASSAFNESPDGIGHRYRGTGACGRALLIAVEKLGAHLD